MSQTCNLVFDEIRQLLLALESDGGLLTPSIYETAQMRLCLTTLSNGC